MKDLLIPSELRNKELFDFLITNKKTLVAQKKYNIKWADSFCLNSVHINENGEVQKGNSPVLEDLSQIKVSSVINTTLLMDSHSDVHIDGLWKKSLQEAKQLYLLQEHSMTFKGIISDEIKAFTKKMSWKDLGLDAEGVTEALIFISNILKNRNTFMFDEYRMGRVKNHSVGMRYVNLSLAINDEDYKEEFAEWNKYIDKIVNRNEAEEQGFFWPVKEAKVVEGSAVPLGSNWATPTLENNMKSLIDTDDQPPIRTGNVQPSHFDVSKAIKETTFLKF